MRVKIARRSQVTIPKEVRRDLKLNVGDSVDMRREGRRVIVEKVRDNWESVMKETKGCLGESPNFWVDKGFSGNSRLEKTEEALIMIIFSLSRLV